MPLASNDIKKSCDKLFCSAHNNLIFVVVSMLFVGHEPVRGMSQCRTLISCGIARMQNASRKAVEQLQPC
jgi:hypothetical protein